MDGRKNSAKSRKALVVGLGLAFAISFFVLKTRYIEDGAVPGPPEGARQEFSGPIVDVRAADPRHSLQMSEAPDRARMNSLRMRFDGGDLRILDSRVLDGYVKPSRAPQGKDGLVYIISDARGKTLWTGSIHDPRKGHYDFLDSDTGLLAGGVYRAPTVEFDIRIPHFKTAFKIEVRELALDGSGVLLCSQELP